MVLISGSVILVAIIVVAIIAVALVFLAVNIFGARRGRR
jgi:hypothetical protein